MLELLIGGAILISGISLVNALRTQRRKARRAKVEAEQLASHRAPDLLEQGGYDMDSDGQEDPERPLDRCRPGDVILHDGHDWLVDAVDRLSDGNMGWIECRLSDGNAAAWLRVPIGDDTFAGWGVPVDSAHLNPPSDQVDMQGKIYTLDRRGRAVRAGDQAEIKFWDYTRPGSSRLWHRVEGDEARTYLGERVPMHQISMLPGS